MSLSFFDGRPGATTAIVEPSFSLSLSSFVRFLLSISFALGLVARPAFVFLGLTSSTGAGAGVGGWELEVLNISLPAFDPPGVTADCGAGIAGAPVETTEGARAELSGLVLGTDNFNFKGAILVVVWWSRALIYDCEMK